MVVNDDTEQILHRVVRTAFSDRTVINLSVYYPTLSLIIWQITPLQHTHTCLVHPPRPPCCCTDILELGSPNGKGHLRGNMSPTPIGYWTSLRVLRPQQGPHFAVMWAVTAVTVATCYQLVTLHTCSHQPLSMLAVYIITTVLVNYGHTFTSLSVSYSHHQSLISSQLPLLWPKLPLLRPSDNKSVLS